MANEDFDKQLEEIRNQVLSEKKDLKASVQLFEGKQVRTAWNNNDEEWYFSIVDVVAVLTDQPDARHASTYWAVLKKRLKEEGAEELLTNCKQLKMTAADGKQRLTDVGNTEQILRIVQSIPSPKAEPFKAWLALIGRERIDEMIDPEQGIDRALLFYKKKGYSDSWINQRLKSIEVRKDLTDEWKRSGVEEHADYAILTNEIMRSWSNMGAKEYKKYKNLKKENLRDNMSNMELILTMLAEASTTEISKAQNPNGLAQSKKVARQGGSVAKSAKEALEKQTGKPVITHQNAKDFMAIEQIEQNKDDLEDGT